MTEEYRDDELHIERVVPDRLIHRFKRMEVDVIRERREQLNLRAFPSEKWLEKKLVAFGFKNFLRNWSLAGRFFGDFVFRRERVILEIDGAHHEKPDQKEYDKDRDEFLSFLGWTTYRIPWNWSITDAELRPKLESILRRGDIIASLIKIPKHMFESYVQDRETRRVEMATVKVPPIPEKIPRKNFQRPLRNSPPKKAKRSQLKSLAEFGIEIPEGLTRKRAAKMIRAAKKLKMKSNPLKAKKTSPPRPAKLRQLKKLLQLGIKVEPGLTRLAASKLIIEALKKQQS